jgi:hypothetical protein
VIRLVPCRRGRFVCRAANGRARMDNGFLVPEGIQGGERTQTLHLKLSKAPDGTARWRRCPTRTVRLFPHRAPPGAILSRAPEPSLRWTPSRKDDPCCVPGATRTPRTDRVGRCGVGAGGREDARIAGAAVRSSGISSRSNPAHVVPVCPAASSREATPSLRRIWRPWRVARVRHPKPDRGSPVTGVPGFTPQMACPHHTGRQSAIVGRTIAARGAGAAPPREAALAAGIMDSSRSLRAPVRRAAVGGA